MAKKKTFHEAIVDKIHRYENVLNESENIVYDVLWEKRETFPEDFFAKKGVKELNEWFGGHDDIVVTENVRQLMMAWLDYVAESRAIYKIYGELPDTDEDDVNADANEASDWWSDKLKSAYGKLDEQQKKMFKAFDEVEALDKHYFRGNSLEKINKDFEEEYMEGDTLDAETLNALRILEAEKYK